MTATVVNGLEVLADEPTEAPMRSRSGSRVVWQQTRTLLLEDGSTVYGCVHCDYTNDNVNSIRPHLNKHRTSTSTIDQFGAVTLAEVVQRLAEFNQVMIEREAWKARATRAERSLSTLKTALRGVTS